MSAALNRAQLPHILKRFYQDDSAVRLFETRLGIDTSSVDFEALRALPANTLGGAYARFLDEHQLSADMFKAPPGMPAMEAYMVKRLRQTHDLWHVLTGYEPTPAGEITLLSFTYAQVGAPSLRLISIAGAIRGFLNEPTIFSTIYRSYRRGQAARYMGNVEWESLWTTPLADVRRQLNLT